MRALVAAAVLSAAMLSSGGEAVVRDSVGASAVRSVSVIVQGLNPWAARTAVERHGGTVTYDLPIVDGVAAEVPADALPAIEATPGVRQVSENEPMTVQGALVSPVHTATAVYRKASGADKLQNEGIDGAGVAVAVIDTGISEVPDLAGRLVGGIDFTPEGNPFQDSFGHGTFVAGIIAGNGASSDGKYVGVAPQANLVSVKIADREGASDVTHVLAALQWVVSFKDTYNIKVVNLSLGTDSSQPYRMSPLNFAVERAWDSGLAVIVSASNNGLNGASTITKPGDDPLVVTVGASDDKGTAGTGDDVMAGFSGMGPTAADGLQKPDLVASGRSVVSLRAPGSKVDDAFPDSRVGTAYFKGSGTSFSTGVVAGATALLAQNEPGLTPDQIKHRLLSTARPGPAGDPNVDGHGQLDAYAAAHAGTLDLANQDVDRSTGLGLISLDRGTLEVTIETGTLLDPLMVLLSGDLTAQNTLFDYTEYLTTEWEGTRWYESQWEGTRWYGTRWYGTRWYESDWSGTRWYGTRWYGTRWYAVAWE
jgi:serine protease AprX